MRMFSALAEAFRTFRRRDHEGHLSAYRRLLMADKIMPADRGKLHAAMIALARTPDDVLADAELFRRLGNLRKVLDSQTSAGALAVVATIDSELARARESCDSSRINKLMEQKREADDLHRLVVDVERRIDAVRSEAVGVFGQAAGQL